MKRAHGRSGDAASVAKQKTNAMIEATAELTGLTIGITLRDSWRVTVALATSAGVWLAVQAGPVPVPNSRRPVKLMVFLAGICIACGIVQAILTDLLETRRHRSVDAIAA